MVLQTAPCLGLVSEAFSCRAALLSNYSARRRCYRSPVLSIASLAQPQLLPGAMLHARRCWDHAERFPPPAARARRVGGGRRKRGPQKPDVNELRPERAG